MKMRFWERDEKDKPKWKWETPDGLREQWIACLEGNDKRTLRERWIRDLLELSERVLEKRNEAAQKTESAHWFARGSAGIGAGVATLSGGALIGGIAKANTSLATYLGLAVAIAGLIAAAIAAARPDQSYRTDLVRKALYEQLWWDVRTYAITQLATADPTDFQNAMKDFAQREATIMSAAAAVST